MEPNSIILSGILEIKLLTSDIKLGKIVSNKSYIVTTKPKNGTTLNKGLKILIIPPIPLPILPDLILFNILLIGLLEVSIILNIAFFAKVFIVNKLLVAIDIIVNNEPLTIFFNKKPDIDVKVPITNFKDLIGFKNI